MTMELDTILCGDSLNVLKALPESSVHCCVTSPPYYGLRDYGMDAQIGHRTGHEVHHQAGIDLRTALNNVCAPEESVVSTRVRMPMGSPWP